VEKLVLFDSPRRGVEKPISTVVYQHAGYHKPPITEHSNVQLCDGHEAIHTGYMKTRISDLSQTKEFVVFHHPNPRVSL